MSRLIGSVSLVVSMMLSTATSAQEKAQKTVVLVHGAFADGSSWDKVIPLLEARGLQVVAVQNPLTSLADDAASVKRVGIQGIRCAHGRATLELPGARRYH